MIKVEEQFVALLREEPPEVGLPTVSTLEGVGLVGLDHGLHIGFRVVVWEEQLDLAKLLVLLTKRQM